MKRRLPAISGSSWQLPALIALGILLRLIAMAIMYNPNDLSNYFLVGKTILNGGQLYVDTPGAYPYPPVWVIWEVFGRLA